MPRAPGGGRDKGSWEPWEVADRAGDRAEAGQSGHLLGPVGCQKRSLEGHPGGSIS